MQGPCRSDSHEVFHLVFWLCKHCAWRPLPLTLKVLTSKRVWFHFHPPIHSSHFGLGLWPCFPPTSWHCQNFWLWIYMESRYSLYRRKSFFPRDNDNQIMNALHFLSSIDSVKPDIILTWSHQQECTHLHLCWTHGSIPEIIIARTKIESRR